MFYDDVFQLRYYLKYLPEIHNFILEVQVYLESYQTSMMELNCKKGCAKRLHHI